MESNQPPTTYQIVMLPLQHRTAVGTAGVEPTLSCSQSTRATVTLHPEISSQVARMGVEPISPPTTLGGTRAESSIPLDERAVIQNLPSVGREALESSSPGLQPGAIPSQLPTRVLEQTTKKGPASLWTPGLQVFGILGFGRASQAQGESQIIRGERGITRPYAFLDRTQP